MTRIRRGLGAKSLQVHELPVPEYGGLPLPLGISPCAMRDRSDGNSHNRQILQVTHITSLSIMTVDASNSERNNLVNTTAALLVGHVKLLYCSATYNYALSALV